MRRRRVRRIDGFPIGGAATDDRQHSPARGDNPPPLPRGPGVKHQGAGHTACGIEARNRFSCLDRIGIAAGRKDDTNVKFIPQTRRARGERARHRGTEQPGQVLIEHREHDLGLGIPKAHIELDHFRTLAGQHQTDIQESAIGVAPTLHALEHGPHDPLDHIVLDLRRHQWAWGECAHATRVRSAVVVEDALVVLRRRQRHEGGAVGKHEVRGLLPRQEFFQDDPLAGRAEPPVDHRRTNRRFRHRTILGDHDAFACGQAVGLDDDGIAELASCNPGERRVGRVTDPEARRRHPVSRHEGLRERFARFQLRRRRGRTDDRTAFGCENIDNAAAERHFGPDDGDIDILAHGDGEQVGRVGRVGRDAPRDSGYTRVPGCAQDLGDGTFTRQLPRKRVLACAAADDENSHVNRR